MSAFKLIACRRPPACERCLAAAPRRLARLQRAHPVGSSVALGGGPMMRVTERAAQALKELLIANQTPDDQGVKVFPDPAGGIAMAIAPVAASDEVVNEGGRPLLIVDAELVERLGEALLDFTRDADDADPRFQIREPPARSGRRPRKA